ncbi:ribbon-helix-helix protein, CopG family [Mycolicibacter sp. MYC123]|uniref:Ribbon-helix-helix protein, CopG family n=2 Tax=Mycolicibacter TaxID=1073531 RepID=A0ABU5YJP9_9MYCO|nr:MULTISPECIES: ribbon-helix-helix protein, CopG family [unclassified Mycolicibacter]MEB3050269.1 ribbon-helix-helix protein, CopG family [Mycolicibacter sp. MYC123]MEB3064803.1 ribbon-helix-helix protein, CopG family [Mycolicibacter sp. MYC101]MEB3069354.1 ribbon-helix-helix protein, CopG family [Mycolicibacter sp. MYC017]
MKLSVSLSDADVAALDAYVAHTGLPSRSAGLQRAIRMLRYPTLGDDYRNAWADWSDDNEEHVWDTAVADGISDAAR